MPKKVAAQILDNLALEACLFSVCILKTMYTLDGMDNITRQATTNKQLEILFKFTLVPFSGGFAFLRRALLEIWNSLKFRHTNEGNTVVIKIITQRVLEMMKSYMEIT